MGSMHERAWTERRSVASHWRLKDRRTRPDPCKRHGALGSRGVCPKRSCHALKPCLHTDGQFHMASEQLLLPATRFCSPPHARDRRSGCIAKHHPPKRSMHGVAVSDTKGECARRQRPNGDAGPATPPLRACAFANTGLCCHKSLCATGPSTCLPKCATPLPPPQKPSHCGCSGRASQLARNTMLKRGKSAMARWFLQDVRAGPAWRDRPRSPP